MDEFIKYQHRIKFRDAFIQTLQQEQAELKKLGYSDKVIVAETIVGLSTFVAYLAKDCGSLSREDFAEKMAITIDHVFGRCN